MGVRESAQVLGHTNDESCLNPVLERQSPGVGDLGRRRVYAGAGSAPLGQGDAVLATAAADLNDPFVGHVTQQAQFSLAGRQ
jgi:hypothetical protein